MSIDDPRHSSWQARTLAMIGVIVADLVSAFLAWIPLGGFVMRAMQWEADTIGPPRQVLDPDETGLAMLIFVLVLLSMALVPAIATNMILRRRLPIPGWAALLLAIVLISFFVVVEFFTPYPHSSPMADLWGAIMHG